MDERIAITLFKLCNKLDVDLAEVERYILDSKATAEEITHAAFNLASENVFERHVFESIEGRPPAPDELVTTNWVALFELFIQYGLLPNLIYTEDDDEYTFYNVMLDILHIDNGDVASMIMRRLLQIGGDPNLNIGGVRLFSDFDADVLFDIVELEDKRLFDIRFKLWLVMMGYGGYINDHECPVKMKNSYRQEIFKEFEAFDYEIERDSKDWIMHIYRKDTREEVAVL